MIEPQARLSSGVGVTFDAGLRRHMLGIFNGMGVGLIVTGTGAFAVASTPVIAGAIFGTPLKWLAIFAPLHRRDDVPGDQPVGLHDGAGPVEVDHVPDDGPHRRGDRQPDQPVPGLDSAAARCQRAVGVFVFTAPTAWEVQRAKSDYLAYVELVP